MYKTVFPFGNADVKNETAATTKTVEVYDNVTAVDFGEMSGNMALSIDIHPDTKQGALLVVKAKSDGTARNITAGTGLTGPGITGTISKTKTATFILMGAAFVQIGGVVQLD